MSNMLPASLRDSKPAKRIAEVAERRGGQIKRLKGQIDEITGPAARTMGFGKGAAASYVAGRIDAKWQPITMFGKETPASAAVGGVALLLGIFGGSDTAYSVAEGMIFPHFYNKGLEHGVK